MYKERVWVVIGLAVIMVSTLGCATTGSVRNARAFAQRASLESKAALAATKALAKKRDVDNAHFQAALTQLEGQQQRLKRRLERLQVKQRLSVAHTSASGRDIRVQSLAAIKAQAHVVMAQVVARAHALAAAPYKAPILVAPALRKLSFTDYGKLAFTARLPGWPVGTPFHIQLYPAGYLFTWPESIHVVSGGKDMEAHPPITVLGDPGLQKRIPSVVPPAGFSVYTPFSKGTSVNEFLSFLGASYFRAVGRGQAWGLSARGVAVDTALPHSAEEFPYFRAFWIVASHAHARHLVFCALLDSPSLTGAYRFIVRPGTQTIVDVKAVLFERKHVRRLGMAPLTSMFLQGRFSHKRFDRLVRAAHDSDGLSIAMPGEERLWWPLRDPHRIAIYRFPMLNPQGFGLMQRARRASDYRAYGMHYEDRPSAWVTPEGNWGQGHIVLIELPTDSETNDNISAFWVPQNQGPALAPLTFRYRIAWQGQDPLGAHLAYVAAARHAYDAATHAETYVIDFEGEALAKTRAPLTPYVHVLGPARVLNPWLTRNADGQWRMQFEVARTGSASVVIHAALMAGHNRVSETWANELPHPR